MLPPQILLTLELALVAATLFVMLIGVVGAVLPIVPGAWLIWLVALAYGLLRPLFGQPLFDGWIGGVAMAVLTVLAVCELVLELVVTGTVAKQGGVSWQALGASLGLGLVGIFFFPPIGPLVGATGGLLAVEYFRHGKDWSKAWASLKSYAKGFGLSVLAEVALCFLMIGVWGVWVVTALAVRSMA